MKIETIRENHLFARAYKKGKSSVQKNLVVYALKDYRKNATFRVGFTVSKKQGGAVARNRVRRMLREAVRSALVDFPALRKSEVSLVIVARTAAFDRGVKTEDLSVSLVCALNNLGLVS